MNFIAGPTLPYSIVYGNNAMVESHDGRGVLIFGGVSKENSLRFGGYYSDLHQYDTEFENRILELRVGSNSWNILNITLK